jgi:hypothetical protein
MPLPIAPRSDLASIPPERLTVHHGCFPRMAWYLRNRGGLALRVSRLQITENRQHNFGPRALHFIYQEGPILPTEEDEQAGLVVLGLANFLPDEVVDTSRGEPCVRPRRDWEYRRLSEPGTFVPPTPLQVRSYRDKWYPSMPLVDAKAVMLERRQLQAGMTYRYIDYGFDPARSFLRDFVLEQDLSEVKPSLRRKFLREGRAEDGLKMLGAASVLASQRAMVKGEGLDTVYTRLYRAGRLHPMMPEYAGSLIMHKLGNYAGRSALLPELRARLRGSVGSLAIAA